MKEEKAEGNSCSGWPDQLEERLQERMKTVKAQVAGGPLSVEEFGRERLQLSPFGRGRGFLGR